MSNVEAEFQISLIKQMTYNLFGMNEFIFAAFTQHVWWQLYNKSAPFREMNFQPEIFMAIPTSDYMDKTYGLKAFRLGFLHDSNAQEGYRSRSWNRLYISALWQWNNLFCSSRIWYRIPEQRKSKNYYDGNGYNPDGTQTDPNENGDDNPDIEEYFGIGDLTFHYLYGQSEFVSVMRYNFGMGGKQRGSVELDWSYPFLNSTNVFWFTKVFSGYGESLIDYDRSLNKIAFGFSFSRSMF
jgi:phospholipase A1